MRIERSILAVSMLVLFVGFTGCGSHQPPPPPDTGIAAALPFAPPPQGGFGGIACGAPPQANMKLVRTAGDLTFYTRPSDPMRIAAGQLTGETYRFYKNQFEGALLQTSDSNSSAALLVHMRNLIGPGTLVSPIGPKYTWADANLAVEYDRDPGAAGSDVLVACRKVQAQQQAAMAGAPQH
ncbi:MAG TPA: hypothetical protein VMA09_13435 [Candidatus Binataceae bacterium]|nr:hypothetical protein [Candidatus Binataceae bacterium]